MKRSLCVLAPRLDPAAKAAEGAASVVCLDLEDGVAPDQKAAARADLPELVDALARSEKPVAVRLNASLDQISFDLEALPDGVHAVVLPMAGSRHQLAQLDAYLTAQGDTEAEVIALIETPEGLHDIAQCGRALPGRLTCFALGTEDFAAATGTEPDGPLVQHAFGELASLAARESRRLLGYPGSIANFRDLEAFAQLARAGRAHGAIGGFAIHPKQVDVLNEVFGPSAAEIERARRIIAAFEAALAEGLGAIQLDGKMIDKPVYQAAKRLLTAAD